MKEGAKQEVGEQKKKMSNYEQSTMIYMDGNVIVKPIILHDKQKSNRKHLAIEVWAYL